MQLRSGAIGLGLGLFSSFLAVTSSQYFEISRQTAFAEAVTPACPLPREIAVTFLGSKCKKVKLLMPQTFFRYYSNENNKKGRFLTTDQYQTNTDAIKNLALNQTWGNQAEKMLSITLPAGTVVYEGVVAPQHPASCYPGGGQQTFIESSTAPDLFWTEGPALTSQTFTCP